MARSAGRQGEFYLYYFGVRQPGRWTFDLPKEANYRIEIVDTWEMTIVPLEGLFQGKSTVDLPGKPYMAVRITKVR